MKPQLLYRSAMGAEGGTPSIDWKQVAYTFLASRHIDEIEETQLVPQRKVLYQFSARGHELSQIILGSLLKHQHDAVGAYYRSRPLLLTLGLSIEDAFSGPLAKSGGFSDGRDIGVVCNLPEHGRCCVLPMSGDVGSQFTPAAGWAQAILYHEKELKNADYRGAIAVAHSGEGAVATNGFWSALTMSTTQRLPLLFFIEDNAYGISVPSHFQTPGANIAENLKSFKNLAIFDSDGTCPKKALAAITEAVSIVRAGNGPALVRLTVPRLSGHSGQDTQAYKPAEVIEKETARDPLPQLKSFLVPKTLTESDWKALEETVKADVTRALDAALSRPEPDASSIKKYVFSEANENGSFELQIRGGLLPSGHIFPKASSEPEPEPQRINMVTAIRRTLQSEMKSNKKVVVFGEDVGPKGGVHAATLGLQEEFGENRVFDTSLSEEGIIGRAVGMAIAGLMPVPEIQFRKYADPATEQLNNCGTIRWRTNNRFAAPIVVRIPGGYFKCGDPWHSVSNEVLWAHAVGWQVCMPSNAEDAVGLLRAALRSNNPTIFFEHRAQLDSAWARRGYPGDSFVLPIGKAKLITHGSALTVVTWGGMVERCEQAAKEQGISADIIDLRCMSPWDKQCVFDSVSKTRRCLIVHEDGLTAGFGAEISASLAEELFFSLDAPIMRVAVPDIPIPHNVQLMEQVVPNVSQIADAMAKILET